MDCPRSNSEIKTKLKMEKSEKQLGQELKFLWELDLIMMKDVGTADVKWRYHVTTKGMELEQLVDLLVKLYASLGGK